MPVGSNSSDWLAAAFAVGVTDRIRRALAEAGTPDLAWPERVRSASARTGALDLAGALDRSRGDPRIAATLQWLADPRHHLLSVDDPAYPALLREIDDAPVLLYVSGRLDLLDRPALAMVGSRNPSPLGAQTARMFARSFSEAGLTVISGLALGIDTASHRGALDAIGSTIAVVGTGLDIVYPAKNRDLAAQIAERGTLVSEFPLGMSARPDHFPRRNRILSGLALGCLVVEANLRSGSLITARMAAEQGRDVFAIPGSIHSPLSKGCHLLIRQGARLTESAADVVQELGWGRAAAGMARPDGAGQARRSACERPAADLAAPAGPTLPASASAPASAPAPGTDADALLSVLTPDPVSTDTLGGLLGWTPQRVNAALVELELAGRLALAGHGLYQRLAEPGFDIARRN
jgi:DNA processing protein